MLLLVFQGCNTAKYVPDGEYLLDKVDIKSNVKGLGYLDLNPYLKQTPNYKIFGLYKLPLHLYSVSGRDSSRFYNRWLKTIGEGPVLYDTTLTIRTQDELRRVFINKGYVNASVSADVKFNNKKVEVTYVVHPNKPYLVGNYKIELNDSLFDSLNVGLFHHKNDGVAIDSASINHGSLVKKNMAFDLNVLDEERARVTNLLRQNGYYIFNKEYIGFVADTLRQSNTVDLEMVFYPFTRQANNGSVEEGTHKQYVIKSVDVFVDYDPLSDGTLSNYHPSDSLSYDMCRVYYGNRGRYIKPSVLMESIHLRPGIRYSDQLVNMTYSALSRLNILRNINIRFIPFEENDSTKLGCIITCSPDKRQGFVSEIEGTKTDEHFGLSTSLSYRHRNIFKGSELFGIKLHAAFDALSSSSFQLKDNYYEVGGETSLTFPRFLAPFLSRDFKRKSRASTQFTTSYTYQQYPEYYKRTILSGGVKYIWQDPQNTFSKQTLDLLDVSYVHFPYLSKSFYNKLPAYTRVYSFQDQFIASIGYTYSITNYNPIEKTTQPIYSFRASVETAGNLLDLGAKLMNVQKDTLGLRKIFDTYYAQYAKANIDYSKSIRIDTKNTIAWHIGGGIAVPYGNSKIIPVQKRFYSGGANSVRGWNVRELGPGSFYSDTATFYNHSGDIRLDANLEYRSKVFWKLELAAFLDAGNIWTIKNYEDQPGGKFQLDSFYKQIAASWGLGFRLDFEFVLIRLDCGWKLYDPAENTGRAKWQVAYPFNFSRNTAWHIAVGYPF
jgi:outer membrane protein assembly factor BamA